MNSRLSRTSRGGGVRYCALLRGVSPMNAKMPELKRCFEAEGFSDVKTVLASGNVVFSASRGTPASLAKRIEEATERELGNGFMTFVRPIADLRALIDSDPYRSFRLPAAAKRVVTFTRTPPRSKLSLPIELHGASILHMQGAEVFSAYVPSPRGPVFMSLIEKTFGKEVTTRTWDTVLKIVRAGEQ